MRRRLLFSFLFSLIALTLTAQPSGYPGRPGGGGYRGGHGGPGSRPQNMAIVNGSVYLNPDDPEQKEVPGVGVVVTVITSKKDTLHTTVGENGRFRMFNVPSGKSVVSFSMLGYHEESKVVNLNNGENRMVVYLKPKKFELQETVFQEDVAPVSVKGDTVIFNAAAVKVNKGEMAIDILEQMPGVEVSESGVTVLNEEVRNVYIDGALLFGEAPMRALNNLPAEEVVTIKSYQEYANKDPYHKISKNESKERVLDVNTRHKPKFVSQGDFIGGGGFDTDSTYHKFRYTFGGDVGAFSEKLQSHLSYNINNINDGSNRRRGNSFRSAGGGGSADLRDINVSVGVTKKWMSPTARNFALGQVGASYSFSDNYSVNESISQRIYFPNEKYDSRETNSTSYSDATKKSHSFSVSGYKSLRDGRVGANGSFSINDNLDHSRSTSYNIQDNLAPQGTSSSSSSDSRGRSYSGNLSFRKRFANKIGFNVEANASQSDNDSGQHKIDTTTSTITYKEIDINGTGMSRRFGASSSVRWEIDDNRSLSARYSYSNNYQETERFAYDVTDPLLSSLDTVNTYVYVTDNNSHTASLSYDSYLEGIKAILRVVLPYSSTGLNRDETFPYPDGYDRRFNSFNPSITLGTESQIDRWHVSASSGNNAPSLSQVRPKINNSNLYSVSAGNPDLLQSRNYDFSLGYSTVLGAEMRDAIREIETEGTSRNPNSVRNLSTFSVDASFSTTRNPIVSKRIYYAEETYLDKYNYSMPAQSTFSTYENAPNSYGAGANARLDIPLEKIQWLFNSSLSFNWDSSPTYVDYVLTRTQNFRPSLRLGMRSNFSRNVRLNVNGNMSYVYSHNDAKDNTSYFVERLNFGWEVNNILRHIYAGGNYMKSFTQGLVYGRVNDNIFNAKAGVKFGPRNNIDFYASVHDLFNKTTGFSTSMNSDYIGNSWKHNFGRYVMFTLAYRFNSMRGRHGGRIGGGGMNRPAGQGPGGPGRGGSGPVYGPGGGGAGFGR